MKAKRINELLDQLITCDYGGKKYKIKCLLELVAIRNIRKVRKQLKEMTEKMKEEQQEYLNKLAVDFRHIDDVIHENIMRPAPKKFTGLACRYQTVKEP